MERDVTECFLFFFGKSFINRSELCFSIRQQSFCFVLISRLVECNKKTKDINKRLRWHLTTILHRPMHRSSIQLVMNSLIHWNISKKFDRLHRVLDYVKSFLPRSIILFCFCQSIDILLVLGMATALLCQCGWISFYTTYTKN